MRSESDILTMSNNSSDLDYTGIGDRDSNIKTIFTKSFPKLVEKNQNRFFDDFIDDSDDLQGQGLKIIIPSNIIDIYTKLEVILGIKL